MRYISVHLPKTAGVSFLAALYGYFGRTAVFKDYHSNSEHIGARKRHQKVTSDARKILVKRKKGWNPVAPWIKCVHGHFMPFKYALLRDVERCVFITWMRHPVDRVLSHWEFWRSKPPNMRSPNKLHRLHQEVYYNKWPFEKYALSEASRNIYRRYLWGFRLDQFDFVGITEHYKTDLEQLSNMFFKTPLEYFERNVSKDKLELESGLKKRIIDYHIKDMRLYDEALNLRERRI